MNDVKLLLIHSNTWNHLTVCQQMINSKENLLMLDRNTWNPLTVCKREWAQARLKIL